MKKNISINISGIIFHIEEDGYEILRRYLDSITKYFSTFEDSSEIMADIESRIAEIFLSKLNEGKQVITGEDVNSLIATMGSVNDFKAAEEVNSETSSDSSFGSQSTSSSYVPPPPRKFNRDQRRKIFGGVCSGIASYLNIDALWVRLVFALLAFAWGLAIVVYIILWIAIPGTYDLPEPETGKKMFRDPERKVVGGIAAGAASYLNIDLLATRIIFILLVFAGGFGIFLYIVMWIALPEARTLTDRMQMQGEAVTISNIESTLKKKEVNEGAVGEESALTKILLFPFRLLGMILQALAKIIGPIAEAIRVLVGLFILGIGLTFLISVIATAGITFGILSTALIDVPWSNHPQELGIPLDAMMRAIPGWVVFAGIVGAIIPALIILLLGVSVIAKRIVFSAAAGWTLFAIFIVCVGMLAVGIPRIAYSFKETGEKRVETTYVMPKKMLSLRIREVGLDDFHNTWLTLRGHDEKNMKLIQVYRANGPTKAKAIENTEMTVYNVDQEDSVLTFDSSLGFKEDAIFRAQELDMTLYIPYNTPFVMDKGMTELIENYTEWEYRDGNQRWQLTQQGLECMTCPKPSAEDLARRDLRDFDQLDLKGIFNVRIQQGHEYSIDLKGPETEKDKYNLYRSGNTLVIDFEGKKTFNWDMNFDKVKSDQVYISITMPNLERLEASGFGSIQFDDFDSDEMEIDIRGPIEVEGKIRCQNTMVKLTGKSKLTLSGTSNSMSADVEFASQLKAHNFEVNEAIVEVQGASTAKVNVVSRLEIEEGMASSVDFRGTPEVIRNKK